MAIVDFEQIRCQLLAVNDQLKGKLKPDDVLRCLCKEEKAACLILYHCRYLKVSFTWQLIYQNIDKYSLFTYIAQFFKYLIY